MDPLGAFTPATRTWFEASFNEPTQAQALGWPAIADGHHTLIHAPTGSGKTLAGFYGLWIDFSPSPSPTRQAVAASSTSHPLKALAHDVERNLRAPLAGIRHASSRIGGPTLPTVDTFIRTGDTPPDARQRMRRNPPDILITTPESLYLMLTSAAREILQSVRWVIVDEVHAVAGSKREHTSPSPLSGWRRSPTSRHSELASPRPNAPSKPSGDISAAEPSGTTGSGSRDPSL